MNVMIRPSIIWPLQPHQALAEIVMAARLRVAVLCMDATPELMNRVHAAIDLLDLTMPGRGYSDLPQDLFDLAGGDPAFAPLLAARLLADATGRQIARAVPDAILPEFYRQAMRILRMDAPSLGDDAFRKDLSICLMLSFPCVAQVVEETGGVPRRAVTTGGIGQAMRLARHFATTGLRSGPYFEIHTHTPMLDGFNPDGWDRCYELTAELLKMRPDCLGLVGGSWFYDPALATVSPRLTYLADTPIAGGAFRVRLGASEEDTELATATSATRRTLVQKGEYVPTRWLMIWPRKALLAWAAARKGDVQ